jgi:hypothetical protein
LPRRSKTRPFEVAEAVDRVFDFLGRGLLEVGEVNVADAGANLVLQIDRGVGNLGAHQIEGERLALAVADRGDGDVVPLGPLSILATCSEVMPSVDLPSTEAMMSPRMDAGAERRRVLIGSDGRKSCSAAAE